MTSIINIANDKLLIVQQEYEFAGKGNLKINQSVWICEKNDRLSVFERFKFGSEIFEILQKCCSMECLREIAFYHLVGVY